MKTCEEHHQMMSTVMDTHRDVGRILEILAGDLDGNNGIIQKTIQAESAIKDLTKKWDDHNRRLNNFLWKVAVSAVAGGGLFGTMLKILPEIIK
jgi:hypothetical protein